jgi:hypothetical protein
LVHAKAFIFTDGSKIEFFLGTAEGALGAGGGTGPAGGGGIGALGGGGASNII